MGAKAITQPLLEVHDLDLRIRDRWILRSLNLSLKAGEITAVLGGNGQGKSSLVRMVSGLKAPTSGRIAILGDGLVGVVMENLSEQFVTATVGDELELARACCHQDNVMPWQPLVETLGLTLATDQAPQTLSGGEQVRLLVALAVLKNPRLLILDDPFVFLGWPETVSLMRTLEDLVKQNQVEGCLLTTTETEIAVYSDTVILLNEGRAVYQGSPEGLGEITLPSHVQRPLVNRCAEVVGEGFRETD